MCSHEFATSMWSIMHERLSFFALIMDALLYYQWALFSSNVYVRHTKRSVIAEVPLPINYCSSTNREKRRANVVNDDGRRFYTDDTNNNNNNNSLRRYIPYLIDFQRKKKL